MNYKTGERVKLGTCSDLFNVRYDQKGALDYDYGNTSFYWRLPLPDEDGTRAGYYGNWLAWQDSFHTLLKPSFAEVLGEEASKGNGIVQTTVKELGILINVPCTHGILPLPDLGTAKAFYNGKRFPLRLSAVRNAQETMEVIVTCEACGCRWACDFNEIEAHIYSDEMRLRLLKLCQEYWDENHEDWDKSCYSMADVLKDGHEIAMAYDAELGWEVWLDRQGVCDGDWDDCSEAYKSLIRKHGKKED